MSGGEGLQPGLDEESRIYRFRHPVEWKGETIAFAVFPERVLTEHMIDAGRGKTAEEKAALLIAGVVKVPIGVIRKTDLADFVGLQEAFELFFPELSDAGPAESSDDSLD